MKKTTTIAALSVAALLSATPFLVSAGDDYWSSDRSEQRRDGGSGKANLKKEYSTEEMRIMAYGQALRRFGPGVEVSVDETEDGTYLVQLRDAEQNLMREQEFDRYGTPVRFSRDD